MDGLQTPQEDLEPQEQDWAEDAVEQGLEAGFEEGAEELEEDSEEDFIPYYPPGIEQLRLILAKDVDPKDTLRVYLRIAAIGLAAYYLGTGIFGVVTGG